MKQVSKRLTFSNVMSVIAVFVALGGSAFAAVQLGKNTVGTKQLKKNAVTAAKIKKNAVTTAKIKNEAVTGAKVNEATLGTVPSAALAGSIPPAEPTHLVGTPGQPGFEPGAGNNPGEGGLGFNPVGFYKDHEGIVHLQGIGIAGSSGLLFTLPPGFRPAAGKLIVQEPLHERPVIIAGSGVASGGTDLSGKILGAEGEPIVLDSITFRAES